MYWRFCPLASQDRYRFDMSMSSHEVMGWNNVLGILQYHRNGDNTRLDVTASYNKYGSFQQQEKRYHSVWNNLSLNTGLTEYSLQTKLHHSWDSPFALDEGLTFRALRTRSRCAIPDADIFVGSDGVHPMIQAVNALNYDAWVTGNHDYNYGMDVVRKTISDLNCKTLVGNVYDEQGDEAKAIQYYEKATKGEDPLYTPNALFKLGQMYERQEKWDKALDAYKTIENKFYNQYTAMNIAQYVERASAKASK